MAEQDFEAEFKASVEAWRQSHGVHENDSVLRLIDIFRIHQKHWDESRRQPPPESGDLRAIVAQAAALVTGFEKNMAELAQELSLTRKQVSDEGLNRWTAAIAVLVSALGGFVLGRFWP